MQVSHTSAKTCATLRAGARHTLIEPAAAAPAESGALPCTNFGFGLAGAHFREGCGMAGSMCLTPASPPYALDTRQVGSSVQPGTETMSSTKGQRARTTTPKTTRQPVAGLSWFVEVKGPRGKYLGQYELAFPAEEFLPGTATGYRAAGELLARLEQWGALTPADVHTLFRLALEKPEAGGTSDAGARFALRDVMYQALKFLAAKAQYGAWLDRRIAEAERFARQDAEREQQRIQRSIAARRAKQAARKAAKEGGEQ